jgi:NADH-quinone oxidoreductase subunit G
MPQEGDLVTLSIDGREVAVPRGSTVLHAADQLGIEIPTFCYSRKMDPLGACRMCLVSIEKAKGFPPACATPVAPGMVVHTLTPEVQKTQRGMLEFLLINHPLDCPICDKGGECPLQNLTFKYGPGKSRYTEEKRHFIKPLPIGPQIMLDRERCIVCQLCVRFMDDVADDPQIVLLSRGGKTEVNVFPDRPFDSPFAGNTIELCPVGALTSRKYRFRARPWDL